MTATNAALTTWSTPTPLAGIPNTYIDTFIVKIGSTYHAFLKSTVNMSIDFARASSLTGPYTIWKTGNFVSYDGEGPALVALDNGGWRMYFDGFRVRKYWFTDSYDTFQTWSTPAELPIKQDATFTIVAGLADANGYSLVGTDGRYLSHSGFRLRLDASDGSATFNKDATFVARPGSTSGSVSLESYNFPGRYLRHRNFELWANLYQDSAVFRADSSFTLANPWA
jgi:hypothetical protein